MESKSRNTVQAIRPVDATTRRMSPTIVCSSVQLAWCHWPGESWPRIPAKKHRAYPHRQRSQRHEHSSGPVVIGRVRLSPALAALNDCCCALAPSQGVVSSVIQQGKSDTCRVRCAGIRLNIGPGALSGGAAVCGGSSARRPRECDASLPAYCCGVGAGWALPPFSRWLRIFCSRFCTMASNFCC